MWDCVYCGCRAIAASLGFCPQCFKEKEMPHTTKAGPSNAWDGTGMGPAPVLEEPTAQPEAIPEPEPAPVPALVTEPATGKAPSKAAQRT